MIRVDEQGRITYHEPIPIPSRFMALIAKIPGTYVAVPSKHGVLVVGHAQFFPTTSSTVLKEHHTANRTLSPVQIERIGRDMLGNRFEINGETIIFDWDCLMNNGYHRLTASAYYKTMFESIVVIGVSKEAFKTMDAAKARSTSQVLMMLGNKDTPTIAATDVFLNGFRETGEFTRMAYEYGRSSRLESVNRIMTTTGLIESVRYGPAPWSRNGLSTLYGSRALVCALNYVFLCTNIVNVRERVQEFWRVVYENDKGNAGKWSGPYRLNQFLNEEARISIKRRLKRSSEAGGRYASATVRAWNAYIAEEERLHIARNLDKMVPIAGLSYIKRHIDTEELQDVEIEEGLVRKQRVKVRRTLLLPKGLVFPDHLYDEDNARFMAEVEEEEDKKPHKKPKGKSEKDEPKTNIMDEDYIVGGE